MTAAAANAAPVAIPAIMPLVSARPVEVAPIGVLEADEVLKLEGAPVFCEDDTGEEAGVNVELVLELVVLAPDGMLSVLLGVFEFLVGWLLVGGVCLIVDVDGEGIPVGDASLLLVCCVGLGESALFRQLSSPSATKVSDASVAPPPPWTS